MARGRDIVARWCNLAEQRLEYLTELFETGRWRRFHSELAFLENIQEAKAAVETWRDLLSREASLDNSGDRHVLARPPPSADAAAAARCRRSPVQPSRSAACSRSRSRSSQRRLRRTARDVSADVLVALERQLSASDEAPSAPDAPALDEMPLPALDLDAMQERYPLLRNAL